MSDRDSMIAKVKALWAQADHPNTGEAEAKAFRDKAAELMARYEIDQFVLDIGEGQHEPPIVVGQFRINDFNEFLVPDERMLLAGSIARNFECRGIIKEMRFASADVGSGKPLAPGVYFECIGYKHDFEMVQALYYNLVVDMIAGIFLEPQRDKNYQREFAAGYVDRVDRRLSEFYRRVNDWVEGMEAGDSVAIAIRSRLQRVQDKVHEMYPNLSKVKMKSARYDPNARKRGSVRADQADIGGTKLGSGADRAIGAERRTLGR